MPAVPFVAVIADDLTGANASAALLREHGLRALTLLDPNRLEHQFGSCEALAIDAGTRGLSASAAQARVQWLARGLCSAAVPLIGKRIDSTLRGNIGAEIDAMLAACSDRSLALVVAAVPSLRRITAGGYLLVDGAPLLQAIRLADPWFVPGSSAVAGVIAAQSKHTIASLNLDEVAAGAKAVAARICSLRDRGARIVVADATTGEHLDQLAAAALGLPIVPVDPGPFTAALAGAMQARQRRSLVLAVIGSVTDQTQAQTQALAELPDACLVGVDAANLCGDGANAEIARAVQTLLNHRSAGLRIIASAHTREAVIDLHSHHHRISVSPEVAAERIADGLGAITAAFLDQTVACGAAAITGLYCTGGAVSEAVVRRLGATAIEIECSVLPLAVLGRLRDGRFPGMAFVSKGGLVGDTQAAVRCVEALRAAAGVRVQANE